MFVYKHELYPDQMYKHHSPFSIDCESVIQHSSIIFFLFRRKTALQNQQVHTL